MLFLKMPSLIIEVVIVLVSLALALKKKKKYAWGMVVTFLIYVFYDASNFLDLNIAESALAVAFFVATLSMLAAVVFLYKDS